MDTTIGQIAAVCGRRTLILVALLMLLCATRQRGAPVHAQQVPAAAQELCKLLPPGATVEPPRARQEGGNLLCGAAYPTPRDARGQQSAGVILMEPAKIREFQEEQTRDLNRANRDPNESVILERRPPYGEFGVESVTNFCIVPVVPPLGGAGNAVAAAEANRTQCKIWMFTVTFIRGCYAGIVLEIVGGEWQQQRSAVIAQMRERAQYIDARLKTMPPCPGAPAPATGPLTAGLACEQDRLSEGAVTCAASATGQRADAQVEFEWTVDGKAHGERGNVLTLTGLAPGKHGVSVRAKDTRNNVASNPESVSFTRADPAAAGSTAAGPSTSTQGNPSAGPQGGTSGGPDSAGNSGASGSGGGGGSSGTIPLVAGGAAAIAGALAFLNHQRRNRARGAGPGGTALAPPPPAPPPAPPPNVRPEETRERRPRSPSPQIQVELLLAPSVRMQLLLRQYERSIWGDGADFCFAGYRITMLTPDWSQTLQAVDAKLTGDQPPDRSRVQLVESLGDPASFTGPEAQHRWKVRASWSQGSRQMPLTLTVTAEFRQQETGEVATATAQITPEPLAVIGAEPRMELYTDAPANADGSDWALIRPHLTVFGEPYTGGFELTELEMTPELDRFFFDPCTPEFAEPPPGHRYYDGPAARAGRQAVPLRCKFHLDDEHIKAISANGVPVTIRLLPTGRGAGDGQIRDDADLVIAEHHRACRDNLTTTDLTPVVPATVHLRPSRVMCESIEPERLPRVDAPSAEMYRTRLKLRAASATDQPVKGSDIAAGQADDSVATAIADWKLTFRFNPPEQPPLKPWDPLPGEITVDPDGVDEDGYLTFAVQERGEVHPWYDYDHWQHFYDADERYLSGQCRAVRANLHDRYRDFGLLDCENNPVEFFIGPPCKLYLHIDSAYDRDTGVPIDVVGHPFISLIDERGRELRVGFYPYKSIAGITSVETTEYAGVAIGTAAGAAAGGYLVGPAALALAAKLGIAVTATAAGPITILVALGAAGVGAMIGGMAGTYGVGRIRDEGNNYDGHPPHAWDYCRGWDISRAEYERILARLREWKRQSDSGGLGYDITGGSVDQYGPFTGNCASFAVDICETVGIAVPLARNWDMRRPGNIADGIKADPRCEASPDPYSSWVHKHPWTYGPGGTPGEAGRLKMDAILGGTQFPP